MVRLLETNIIARLRETSPDAADLWRPPKKPPRWSRLPSLFGMANRLRCIGPPCMN